jgi:hypothetical protein
VAASAWKRSRIFAAISGTTVTQAVCRHELRPVLLAGAESMDMIFDVGE